MMALSWKQNTKIVEKKWKFCSFFLEKKMDLDEKSLESVEQLYSSQVKSSQVVGYAALA